MQIEKSTAPALSKIDMDAIIREARYERAEVFGSLINKVIKAMGKMLLGANHSLIEMPSSSWPEEIPFHSRQALGVNETIASKADHDLFISQAAPVLPFAAMRAGLNAAEVADSKIAA